MKVEPCRTLHPCGSRKLSGRGVFLSYRNEINDMCSAVLKKKGEKI